MNPNLNSRIDELIPTLDDYFEKKLEEFHTSGLAIGIYHKGQIKYSKGFGYANIEEKKPITSSTVFRIGSISKTFAGIALMQQWEQGKFKFDGDINQYLPLDRVGRVEYRGIDSNDTAVTFKHLLTHTSGIGELKAYSDVFQIRTGMYFINPMKDPILPLEGIFKKGVVPYIKPGTKWAYANQGVNLLGYLLELLNDNNESFHEYLLNHIFKPLNMNQSDSIWSDRVKNNLATGYGYRNGKFKKKKFIRFWGRPAGGVFSSLDDMFKYAEVLLNKGKMEKGQLLKPETLEMMISEQYSLDSRLDSHGLIFHRYSIKDSNFVWHGGQTLSFNSAMHLSMDDELAVFVFSNTTNSERPAYTISRELIWLIYNASPEVLPKESHPDAEKIEFLEKLTGTYCPLPGLMTNFRIVTGPGGYEVQLQGNQLILKSFYGNKKDGVVLRPADANDPYLFELNEGLKKDNIEPHERVLFVPDENERGKIKKIYFGLNEFERKGLKGIIRAKRRAFIGRLLKGVSA